MKADGCVLNQVRELTFIFPDRRDVASNLGRTDDISLPVSDR